MNKKRKPNYVDNRNRVLVVTSTGVEVECLPIAGLLEQVEASIEMPLPPTYTIEDVSGEQVTRYYTQERIKAEGVSQEDKQAWADYIIARQEAEELLAIRRVRTIATKGIKVTNPSLFEEWEEDHRFLGLNIPEGRLEQAVHWFSTEIAATETDGFDLMLGIYRASGADEEVLRAAEDAFRDSLEEPERDDAPADTDDPHS